MSGAKIAARISSMMKIRPTSASRLRRKRFQMSLRRGRAAATSAMPASPRVSPMVTVPGLAGSMMLIGLRSSFLAQPDAGVEPRVREVDEKVDDGVGDDHHQG